MDQHPHQPTEQKTDDCRDRLGFLQGLIDAIPNPIFYKDRDGRYLGCNKAFEAYLGTTRTEIVGKTVFDLSPPDLAARYHEMDERLFRDGGVQEYEASVLHDDGNRHEVEFHKAVFLAPDGRPQGLVGVILDITERKRAEEALRVSEERFRIIYEQSPIGIELYDERGELLEINAACLEIFGVADPDAVRGFRLFEDPNVSASAKLRLQGGEEVRYRTPFSFDLVREHGLYKTSMSGIIHIDVIITPISAADGAPPARYLVQVQDVTDAVLREENLNYLSMHDQLTGLYNRAYFEMEMERVQKSRMDTAGVIVCDIDGLKAINDTRGHQAGDELIRAAAGIIRKSFRDSDVVARIGGDEFVAIVPNCTPEILVTASLRIDRNIAAHNLAGSGPAVAVSIGAACGRLADRRVIDIFNDADANMYADKAKRRSGRGAS
ncbi:MAG TPA: diguanylate cyclase [Spirochaetota bacterium]|nr:diguanylate cyclase [Spirochaetota bacterium]HNT12945.1 diguanylate cyclase [Spirochaetota bacterium]